MNEITDKCVVSRIRTLAYTSKFTVENLLEMYALVERDIDKLESIVGYLDRINCYGRN